MEQVPGTADQPGNFLLTEDDRQLLEALWVWQIVLHVPALQYLDVEESKRGNLDDDGAVRRSRVFEHIDLIAAKIVRSQVIEPLLYDWRNASTPCGYERIVVPSRCGARVPRASVASIWSQRTPLSVTKRYLFNRPKRLFRPPR